MAYTEEQRQFYSKAKAAGWEPEKIKAGIQRLGERASAQAPAAPAAAPTETPMPAGVVDHGAAPNQYKERIEGMNPAMQALMGIGGAVNNLALGAQQLIPDALTSPEYRADLARQVAQQKQAMGAVEDTTAGQVGSVAGNVGAALVGAPLLAPLASAGLPGAVAAGALEGGVMGALAPTTQPGERAENMGYGAAFGGVIPVAGQAARSVVGQADPAMQKAAEVLKRYGVDVSKSRQSPGLLSKTADFGIENAPVTSNIAEAVAGRKTDKVRDALFNMMGTEAPKTGEELSKIAPAIGAQIGDITKGKTVPVADIAAGVKDVMKDYNRLLPAQRSSQVTKYAKQLSDLSGIKGAKLKSEAYQAIRSDMAAEASRVSPEHAKALRGMVKVLDDEFAKTLSPEEAIELGARKRQYRLAKTLDKANMVKEGEVDIHAARRAVEQASRKGEVMPEARELLEAADIGIPKVKPKGILTVPGATSVGAAMLSLPGTAATLGGAGLVKALLNTGGPQRLVNSPLARKATAKALRGAMQSELSDED